MEKGFFDFEWKKTILPAILIILFIISLISFYNLGQDLNKTSCKLPELLIQLQENKRNNDSVAFNQTYKELDELSKNYTEDIQSFQKNLPIIYIFQYTDPFTPLPCEYNIKSIFCRYYINQESYNCEKEIYPKPLYADLTEAVIKDYKRISIWVILLNVLYILIFGYLLSCPIFYLFSKIKNKKV